MQIWGPTYAQPGFLDAQPEKPNAATSRRRWRRWLLDYGVVSDCLFEAQIHEIDENFQVVGRESSLIELGDLVFP